MTDQIDQKPDDSVGGTDQSQTIKPWEEQLETSLRGNEALRDFTGPNDLAKAFVKQREDYNRLEGEIKGSVKLPGDKATPEEIAAYNKAIGVPDKADGYQFDKIEGLAIDESLLGWWKETAHKIGLSTKAANQIYLDFNAKAIEQAKAIEAQGKQTQEQQEAETLKAKSAAEVALKEKWGKDYEGNYELTRRLMKKFGNTELGEKFIASGFGNDPSVVDFLFRVAKEFKDDTLADTSAGGKEPLKEGMLQFTYPSMER